ncbi:aldo/keto reductase [Pseudomonas cavernae]|uniref:Aldo/keto reductase n=2 Tax=Pseudomonas cavernae TaxID=2320867 RepID=A0A385Z8C7_9PSED|nr:aldo/keto reductase [Pseudomonas cavernae]
MSLGCFSMSNAYGRRDDSESLRVIHRALDEGINLLDTADYYGWGHNEELIAKAIAGRRAGVLLSSKFGYVPKANLPFGLDSRPEYVKQACEASLFRLNTDCIDLYFQHRLDPQVPIEETVGAMAELVQEGKVRRLGLCEVSEQTLRKAHAVHPISAVQVEYSLWTREIEQQLGFYDELGVSVMAFSPLARGMLSGQLRSLEQMEASDVRRFSPRFYPENFPKNLALVDQLGEIAKRFDCTSAQLALAWLFRQHPNVIAICGSDTLPFLDDNLGALAVELDDATSEVISALFQPGKVHGDRYHPLLQQMLDK